MSRVRLALSFLMARAPAGREHIEFVMARSLPIGNKHQLAAIRREFRERCEASEIRYLLKAGTIDVDQEKFKFSAVAIEVVRGEEKLLTIGCEGGRERGAVKIRNLTC